MDAMVTSQSDRQTTRSRPAPGQKKCPHFWKIPPPQGELSWGTCDKCGKRKRFSNRFDGRDRTNNSDIFSRPNERASGFRPDRSSTYYDSSVQDAFESTKRNAN